jgi:hypothetical protein
VENPRDDLASVLEQITARLEKLESRVSSLEQHPQPVRPLSPSPTLVQAHPLTELSPVRVPGAGTAMGKLFLGIAGGYVLRALAESGALSQLATVLLALLYAAAWLVWAARMSSDARLASTAYAATAALIFSPMLWEVTLRFKVFPNTTSAAVLAAFVALASALAWKRSLISVAWVASFFPAVVALMLLVASRDPAPFAAALLAMAALTEYAGTHDRAAHSRFGSLRHLRNQHRALHSAAPAEHQHLRDRSGNHRICPGNNQHLAHESGRRHHHRRFLSSAGRRMLSGCAGPF